jgi:hypothetical protein
LEEVIEMPHLPRSFADDVTASPDAASDGVAAAAAGLFSDVENARARYSLGVADEARGNHWTAVAHYIQSTMVQPQWRAPRDRMITLLVELGRSDDLWDIWSTIEPDEGDSELLAGALQQSLNSGALALAREYARLSAALRWGSRWYPAGGSWTGPSAPPNTWITAPKLLHDAEQFEYLQREEVLGPAFDEIIHQYRSLAGQLQTKNSSGRALDDAIRDRIGHVYNRIVHIADAPRVAKALSETWDGPAIEKTYFTRNPGVVIVDDALATDAFQRLQRFCLGSTVWLSNQHAYGRLGAHFQNGFNAPLLVQIAEELRDTLPNLIGRRYPLRHIWGYKSPATLPADSVTHADFAAVNVNFWITPDDANLDAESGGLVIHGVEAPLHWDFSMYNARLHEVIVPFLERQQASTIRIPYRANRAIIFNSDLFHGTDGVMFRPEYEHRRINVTLLYGDRADDDHHRGLVNPDPLGSPSGTGSSWRSAAFARRRLRGS